MIRITGAGKAKDGELILGEHPRSSALRQFNDLPFARRLERVRAARGRHKYDLLIEAADASRLLAELSPQDVYLLAREIGAEELVDLLPAMTTEQFTACIDLDGWSDDELDPRASLSWPALLLEAGEEQALQTLRELDFELLVLLFAKQVAILHGPEDIEDEDVRIEAMRRDGGYALEYRDPEAAKVVAALLDILCRNDHPLFVQVLESVRWEPLAELEEEVYRQRCGRLLELGFPSRHEARRIYAWVDPERFAVSAPLRRSVPAGDEVPPAFALLDSSRPAGLLGELLHDGIDAGVAAEFVYLINKVLVAERVDVGEGKEVAKAAAEVYATVNLALDYLAGKGGRAEQSVAERYVEDLFRLGVSLTLQLQRRARALLQAPVARFLDTSFRSGIEILAQERPRCFPGLKGIEAASERPFATLTEWQAAEAWLRGVEAQRTYFEELAPFALPGEDFLLKDCEPSDWQEVTLSELWLTAFANALLGGDFAPSPLTMDAVRRLQAVIVQEGGLDAELRRTTVARCEAEVAGLGSFVGWALDLWAEGICRTPAEELDPRHVEGLIVLLPKG